MSCPVLGGKIASTLEEGQAYVPYVRRWVVGDSSRGMPWSGTAYIRGHSSKGGGCGGHGW